MKNPVVRSQVNLTYSLELDAATVIDLERALSFAVDYQSPASESVHLVLQVLKGLVYRMTENAPILAEFAIAPKAIAPPPVERVPLAPPPPLPTKEGFEPPKEGFDPPKEYLMDDEPEKDKDEDGPETDLDKD